MCVLDFGFRFELKLSKKGLPKQNKVTQVKYKSLVIVKRLVPLQIIWN